MNSTWTVEQYKDAAGEWRWRLKSANGRIVATSGEGYKNSMDCLSMFWRIVHLDASGIVFKEVEA